VRLPPEEFERKTRGPEAEPDGNGATAMAAADDCPGESPLLARLFGDRSPAPTSSVLLVRLLPDEFERKTRRPESEADGNGTGLPWPVRDAEERPEEDPDPGLVLRRRR
jgi:hypothetical protein